jgi:hypothetical protein
MLKHKFKNNVGGFTLVEVGIASVIGAMIMGSALMFVSDYLAGQSAQAKGQQLFALNQAVNSYESKYSVQLANNQAIAIPSGGNVANIYAPTTTELYQLQLLPNSTPQGAYLVKINSTLVGGVPSGLVWLTQPFVNAHGEVDASLAGDAMLAGGGDAGMSTVISPGTIMGADSWTATNPVTNTAGIVAMRNGAGSGAYVRLDGSTPMQGSLNFNGFNVTSAGSVGANSVTTSTLTSGTTNAGALTATTTSTGTLTASGTITANGSISGSTLTATATGVNGVMFGASALFSDGSNSAIRQNGSLLVTNLAGSSYSGLVAGNISAQGSLAAQGTLQLANQVVAGVTCAPDGAISRDGPGNVLSCLNGVWTVPNAAELASLQSQITNNTNSLQSQITNNVNNLQNQVNSLQSQITNNYNSQAGTISSYVSGIQAQVNGMQGQINSLSSQVSSGGGSGVGFVSQLYGTGNGNYTVVEACSNSPFPYGLSNGSSGYPNFCGTPYWEVVNVAYQGSYDGG